MNGTLEQAGATSFTAWAHAGMTVTGPSLY